MADEDDYTDETLEATPSRVTQFLQGIGAEPAIRTALFSLGNMQSEDIVEGRDLLLQCLATPGAATVDPLSPDAKKARAAAAGIDQWDEPNFARFGAALKRSFPAQWDYVFEGGELKASTGAKAIEGVQKFLSRVTALETGSDDARAASKEEDAKAVALLAKRGLTKEVRAGLAEDVQIALGPTSPVAAVEVSPEQRHVKLVALRAWFDEWSAVARAVIKKRSHLIRLGLASRRRNEPEDPAGGGSPPGGGAPPK